MSPSGHEQQPAAEGPPARVFLLGLALLALATAEAATAQETGWTGRLFLQAQSVEEREAWIVLRQAATLSSSRGRLFEVGLTQTRRFGDWDASIGSAATLRPGGGSYLSLDARVTPEADVIEDVRFGARIALPLGELVPSLGYRLQIFGDEPVHSLSPRLNWYRGPWLFSGEVRVIRSALETTNVAAIGRVTRRVSESWSVRLGVARGEEDFLVGRPPDRSLLTLTSRSLSAGAEHQIDGGWWVRLDMAGIDTDQGIDRLGGSVTVARAF